jgi:hypothetical protein
MDDTSDHPTTTGRVFIGAPGTLPSDSKWFEVGHLADHPVGEVEADEPLRMRGESNTLDLTVDTPIDRRVLQSLFGAPLSDPGPRERSIILETKEMVRAEPRRPVRVRGFRAWWNGTNRKARRAYEAAYEVWCASGRPEWTTATVRRVVPRATITSVADHEGGRYALTASVLPTKPNTALWAGFGADSTP